MARDDAAPRPAVPRVGERIRAERLRQGRSLRALARSVGLSASLISQIETGKCQPSVSTLYAITTALGVPIEGVFEAAHTPRTALEAAELDPGAFDPGAFDRSKPDDRELDRVALDHAGAGEPAAPGPAAVSTPAALASGTGRRAGPLVTPADREVLVLDSGVTWERLGHVPGAHMDFLLVSYAPGGSSSSTDQSMRHGGVEYGYLIDGELTLTLGFETLRLTAGDAITFPSSTPHRYRNEGTVPAVGVWFVAAED